MISERIDNMQMTARNTEMSTHIQLFRLPRMALYYIFVYYVNDFAIIMNIWKLKVPVRASDCHNQFLVHDQTLMVDIDIM